MQPLFRPMDGHPLHSFGSFHALANSHNNNNNLNSHAKSAHRANLSSTPVSDDELDIDDSVSLSSNADGSCTSPHSAAHHDKNGKLSTGRTAPSCQ